MRLTDVLPYLLQGRKARRSVWVHDAHVCITDGVLKSCNGKMLRSFVLSRPDLEAYDWEFYEPVMTFQEALVSMSEGRAVARLAWEDNMMVKATGGELQKFWRWSNSPERMTNATLSLTDMNANDWIEVTS